MIRIDLQRWYLPAGTPVYEFPGGPVVAKIAAGGTFTTIGIPMDRRADASPGVDFSHRAVILESGALDNVVGAKIAYVTRPDKSVYTDPAWDAAVWKALLDPNFRGSEVIHAEEAELAARFEDGVKEGINRVDTEVERLKASV